MAINIAIIRYEGRLETLKHWPFSDADGATCTAEKLAKAGFFCPNPDECPDAVRCFVCRKELDGWEPMDSALDEHKSHSPKCKFLKLGCKEFTNMKMKDFLEVIAKSQIEYGLDIMNSKVMEAFDADLEIMKGKFLSYVKSSGMEIDDLSS